jgi:cell division protein FtsL
MDEKTLALIKANLKDPALFEVIQKSLLKRARITAIVLGSFLIVSLIAVVYAFVQQTLAIEAQKEALTQKTQMEQCIGEAQKQQGLAAEARIIAEEANKMMAEQLAECQKKK